MVRHLASARLFKEIQNASIEYKVNTLRKKGNMELSKVIKCMSVEWKASYMTTVIISLSQKKYCVTGTLRNTVQVLKGYAVYVARQKQSVVVNACWFT